MEKNDWSGFRNILCLRLDNMGDLVMTMPAIRTLKLAVPKRKITLLTSTVAYPLARLYREIDETIVFDAPWISNVPAWNTESVLDLTALLRHEDFDAAIIFTVYSQSALPSAFACRMAGIPRILAYCRENPYRLITDWIPDREPLFEIKHEVTRQLELVSRTGARSEQNDLFVPLNADAAIAAIAKISAIGADLRRPWLLLHPGVSEKRRQYPAEAFARVARSLTAQNFQVLLTGSPPEVPLLEKIKTMAGPQTYSSGGLLDLQELIGLLSKAPLLISNNTGVIHLAAALKKKVVGVYAATNPQHYPWKTPQKLFVFDVLQEHRSKNVIIAFAYDQAYKNKLKTFTPEDVAAAAADLLSR